MLTSQPAISSQYQCLMDKEMDKYNNITLGTVLPRCCVTKL